MLGGLTRIRAVGSLIKKDFYEDLGWKLDADFVVGKDFSRRSGYTSKLACLDPLWHRADIGRSGGLEDRFDHIWYVATRKDNVWEIRNRAMVQGLNGT